VREAVVEAVATAYRGDVVASRAALEAVGADDDLAVAIWAWAAADYDLFAQLVTSTAPNVDRDRRAVRAALRTLLQVECRGRLVVPVDEESVPPQSPVAGLVGYLLGEAAYSAGLLERSELICRHVLDRARPDDPFVPWVRVTRVRVLAFLGLTDAADDEVGRLQDEVGGWPLGAGLLASLQAVVASSRGDSDAVERAAARTRAALPSPRDQLAAMAVAMTGLALSTAGRPREALEAALAAGDDLELLPLVSRCHAGDLVIDSCLRLGLVADARRHLARSESYDVEPGSFTAAAVERSRARLRALDDDRLPDAGPHAQMYLTRDRALADVAALPSGQADLEALTRLVAGSGLAAVRSWSGREPGGEESSLRLFAGLGWDALPATSRVVARLAASGLRNKDIAAAMFLAEKTVEGHVASVLATLGADSRVEIGDRVPFDLPARELPRLTPRQREVAELVAAGFGNAEIARRLTLSEKTVEKHVAALFVALGVGSRAAVAAVVRSG
jgi:DNA-binding NarL/FixJ family response regulator